MNRSKQASITYTQCIDHEGDKMANRYFNVDYIM